ncbi:uncharacterized protein K02A2.6-like [Cydia pomonella]|uniref:uncharacterized protein K02A2.6-like n=1 Tax=Cydia pomonella TaxID=82600 RepID=UPI002ADDD1D9|nr:uncharacterized protein K02A2.6-like [Cydia pomonella]
MSIGKMSEFDVTGGTWSSYVDRLEMFFLVNAIKDELKLPTMIAVMGNGAYELLVNLASPKKPSEVTYKEAVDLLRHHLQPTPSVLAERYRFRQRRQNNGENIATYVAELKKLARECKFDATLNENLRDQFVCGLRSDIIRQRLFAEEDTLTYTNAIRIATSLEAAERDAAAVEPSSGTGSSGAGPTVSAAVHALAPGGPRGNQMRGSRATGGWRARSLGSIARGSGTRSHAIAENGGHGAGGGSVAAYTPGGRGPHQDCKGCGSTAHDYTNCRFRDYICSLCRRRGHLRRVCSSRSEGGGRGGSAPSGRLHYSQAESSDREESTTEDFHHLCLSDYGPVSVPITVDSHILLQMEIDTGSAISCISSKTYKKLLSHYPLENGWLTLKFYNGAKVKPIGVIKPKVSYDKQEKYLELFVIDGGTTSLLGRQWLAELNIKIPEFSNCNNVKVDDLKMSNEINNLLCRYKELFSGGLGRYNGGQATLRVREGAAPVFHRARPLAYALRERVDAELDAMLRDGVIEAVDCSDWASPLVPVNKADGSLRICADYKSTLNPVLLIDRYPLPKIDDLMVSLSGACYFSKIDLSQAYNQIELDDSKKYTVINTHRGLYRYNRLVYGLSSSPGIFQRIMCNLLKGIPNVEIFLDDVIIGGKTKQEHLAALEAVFSRLHKAGLKLKSSKCVFLVDEVQYLGYIISKDGIKTDPAKVQAVLRVPRPSNVTELRSFLGIINFYGKFIKNMSVKLVPLYELLKKEKQWFWSSECERSFKEIKAILASAEVLAHYDPKKQLFVTCDASSRGVAGVLTQPGPDGRERPVAYASRTLNDAERNYSQIHREALAIIFCMNKFHQYLYGRHFTLRTDHKPLVSIFGPNTGIPTMVASRMQRWAIILSAYSFDIEYVRTDNNGADGFSRLPVSTKSQDKLSAPEQTYLHFVQQALLLDYNEIKRETARDPLLSKVLSYIRDGWPESCKISNLQPYFNRKNELYEELGCVMWGPRLVVPEKCKDKILTMIHEPHMGIVKSKALARSYVWWAGIDEAVERVCRACAVCAAHADAPARHTPRMWTWPHRPWSRLHLDYMGPIGGKTYLVVVDAMSKWIEVFNVTNTTAGGLIDRLCELFSRFGIPKQIVSDNGKQFTSKELDDFTKYCGIEHIFTAPYHPASNGLAENSVRTLKRVIRKALQENQNVERALWAFLIHYRNVEHSTTGESPATLLLGRRLRTRLDTIKPDREGHVRRAQQRQQEAAGGVSRSVEMEDAVWYRKYLKGEKWFPGRIVDVLGPSNYKVLGDDGETVHRHIDQLRKRSVNGRLSLAATTTAIEPSDTLGTDSQGHRSVSAETPVTPVRVRAETSAASADESRGTAQTASSGSASPASPEWQFASPRASTPARARPIRQCRLNKPNYKI